MKLLRIEIESFGVLSEYRLDLTDGLNVICEPNGFGKTTLAAFIKAMLYGLPVTKKRSLDENERKKYTPWQGGIFGGCLEFECTRGRFRIERFFGAKEADDEFRLFDLSTNKPSTAFSVDVGQELLGIDAEGFERSVFLAQNGMDARGGNDSVTAKLTGLLEDINDIGGYEIAVKAIEKRRQFYERTGNRGRIAELNADRLQIAGELEECRRLLPQQTEREENLSALRAEVRETEASIKQTRQKRSDAEVLSERFKELTNTRTRMEERERERASILDAFRDRILPTDAELAQMREQLSALRAEQVNLQKCRLSEPDSERLSCLRARFSSGTPSAETLEQICEIAADLPDLQARLQAAKEVIVTPEQKRFAKTGIPSDAFLASLEEARGRAEQIKQTLVTERARPLPEAKRRIPLALSIPVLAIGASMALIGAFISLPLVLVGIGVAIVGALLLLLGGKTGDASAAEEQRAKIASAESELQKATAYVTDVLSKYDCMPPNGDLRAALTELSMLARHARADEIHQAGQVHAQKVLSDRLAEKRKLLLDRFYTIGYSELPKNIPDELARIRSELGELRRLEEREGRLAEESKHLYAAFEQKKATVSLFLSRMKGHDGKSPEERLSAIERQCERHAALLDEIRRLREELNRRNAETAAGEEVSLPNIEELKRLEEAQERHLAELRKIESESMRDLNRLYEQTVRIPELEDRLRHVNAEWETAKENLATLRTTAKILEEAKETLSTRYLGGMQESFSQYLALLEKDSPKQAVLDVSFDVSVRDGGKSRALESYSRGSKDVLQFCARLALSKALFSEGEDPFLLLDDPFVNLDPSHLSEARKMLDRLAPKLQILYLVCHDSRI